MNDINFSALLRNLVDAYADQRISRVQYLTQRRSLLDRIDREFNGAAPEPEPCSEQDDADVTCPVAGFRRESADASVQVHQSSNNQQ